MMAASLKNADLKDLLSNYRFTAGNQIVAAMKERGYEHRVRKGVHTFKHPVHGTVSIRHKDLVNFQEKIDDATMQDIAERFNLYKFKKDLPKVVIMKTDFQQKRLNLILT